MALMQPEKITSEMKAQNKLKKARFVCPVCKKHKELEIPKSVVEAKKNLTTVSIPRGMICEHQFQAFIDKQFKVRGYQRVDFEFDRPETQQKESSFKHKEKNDSKILKDIIMEGNIIEYNPQNSSVSQKNSKVNSSKKNSASNSINLSENKNKIKTKIGNRTLEDLYNEFKDFIDEDFDSFKKKNIKIMDAIKRANE
jgi:hypothetical protein